jgi:hypothetical protein
VEETVLPHVEGINKQEHKLAQIGEDKYVEETACTCGGC